MDGNDIRLVNPSYLRSQLALVSQEPILFDCSIRENIVYGLQEDKFSEEDIVNVARLANIDKFIKELPDVSVELKFTSLMTINGEDEVRWADYGAFRRPALHATSVTDY